jgi:hypothetical protein
MMGGQVAEADTGNPLLRVLELTRTAGGQVGRVNHFNEGGGVDNDGGEADTGGGGGGGGDGGNGTRTSSRAKKPPAKFQDQ